MVIKIIISAILPSYFLIPFIMAYSFSSSVSALIDSMYSHMETLNHIVHILDNGHIGNAKEELLAFHYATCILSGDCETRKDLDLFGRMLYKNFTKLSSPCNPLIDAERRIYAMTANPNADNPSLNKMSIDIDDVKALFLAVRQAYKGWSFEKFADQCKKDYLSFNNPKGLTYSQWVNGQTIALTS